MILRAENVSVYYGKKTVLSGLNLTINSGEVVGLLGPSGCGKSSFIHALIGSLAYIGGRASGRIMFHGLDLLSSEHTPRPGWDKIALVPQAAMNCFNPCRKIEKSFTEMMDLFLPTSIEKRFDRVYELLGMVQLPKTILGVYPHELSGGMKQRVAIALALLLKPELLIFDEATTGLDVLVEADILKSIQAIQKTTGLSLLFVSHDRRVTGAFCHNLVDIS